MTAEEENIRLKEIMRDLIREVESPIGGSPEQREIGDARYGRALRYAKIACGYDDYEKTISFDPKANCHYSAITKDSEIADCHCVYVVYDASMGYLHDLDGMPPEIYWCSSFATAKKFDSMRTPTARVDALGMSAYLNQRGYKTEVRRFKRCDLYASEY